MTLDDDGKACNFVYRPPDDYKQQALPATLSVKFAQSRVVLNDAWIIGGTPWRRFKFRMKHPIVYSKRGILSL